MSSYPALGSNDQESSSIMRFRLAVYTITLGYPVNCLFRHYLGESTCRPQLADIHRFHRIEGFYNHAQHNHP